MRWSRTDNDSLQPGVLSIAALPEPLHVPEILRSDRRALIREMGRLAQSWRHTQPMDPRDTAAAVFIDAMLPILMNLYDDLVEHYADYQESLFSEVTPERPELWSRADRLRLEQADALVVLAHLGGRLRRARGPDEACLARIEALSHELAAIDEAETDLLYEAHYIDLAAID